MSQSRTEHISYQVPFIDHSQGWKWWDKDTDRWYEGAQWTETYREAEQPRTLTIGYLDRKFTGIVDDVQWSDDEAMMTITMHVDDFPHLPSMPYFSISEKDNKKENE